MCLIVASVVLLVSGIKVYRQVIPAEKKGLEKESGYGKYSSFKVYQMHKWRVYGIEFLGMGIILIVFGIIGGIAVVLRGGNDATVIYLVLAGIALTVGGYLLFRILSKKIKLVEGGQ